MSKKELKPIIILGEGTLRNINVKSSVTIGDKTFQTDKVEIKTRDLELPSRLQRVLKKRESKK